MQHPAIDIPDELTMIERLPVTSVDCVPADGYWCYEFSSPDNIKLRLFFDVVQRSLQTILFINEQKLQVVVQEGLRRLDIVKLNGNIALEGECEFGNVVTSVIITFVPTIFVEWSTLVTKK
jgi:hypothetical protein